MTDDVLDDLLDEVRTATPDVAVYSPTQLRRARELLARIHSLRRARRLYPAEHPAVVEAAHALFDVVALYHAEGTDVTLTFFDDEVLLGQQVLAEESVLFDQLIRDLSAIGAGSITFRRGVVADEVVRFAEVLGAHPEDLAGLPEGILTRVGPAGLRYIVVSAISVVRNDVVIGQDDAKAAAKAAYVDALDLMRELDRLVRTHRSPGIGHVKTAAQSLVANVLRNGQAMLELSGLRSFEEYTFYHSINVAILSLALASKLTRDYRFLSSLGVGALLHDIGKMSVDIAILNKPGPLTNEEQAEMREHPLRGAETVSLTTGIDRASVVCVLEHHMRYDHTGYPLRSPAREQHVMSRIVAVADAYDAMTSRRVYSAPRTQHEAMATILGEAGTALDPTLARLFVEAIGYFPPRSVVLLSTGETAVVVGPSLVEPARPLVRIIADRRGALIDPFDCALDDAQAASGRSVIRCLDPASLNVDIDDFF